MGLEKRLNGIKKAVGIAVLGVASLFGSGCASRPKMWPGSPYVDKEGYMHLPGMNYTETVVKGFKRDYRADLWIEGLILYRNLDMEEKLGTEIDNLDLDTKKIIRDLLGIKEVETVRDLYMDERGRINIHDLELSIEERIRITKERGGRLILNIDLVQAQNIRNAYIRDEEGRVLYNLIEEGRVVRKPTKKQVEEGFLEYKFRIFNPAEAENYFLVVEDNKGGLREDNGDITTSISVWDIAGN